MSFLSELLSFQTLIAFCVILLTVYIILDYFKLPRCDIPGPTPWPILHNIPIVFGTKNASKSFLKLQKKYGDLVRLRIGKRYMILVFGYKNVKDILVTNADKTKFRNPNIKKLFKNGGGVASTNGQKWSDIRKFTIVALKDFGVGKKSLEQRIIEETECLITTFTQNNREPIDTSKLFPMATANVISNVIFGSRFDLKDPEFKRLIDAITRLFKVSASLSITAVLPFLFYLNPFDKLAELKACRDEIQTYVRGRINEQRKSFDPQNIRSFIDLYLEQQNKADSNISEECLFFTIADLYFAGTDTTAVTLQWCMLYMLKYPDIQKRCREEIHEVIGDGRLPVMKDKDHLPYVMATINEVQRVSTIAPNGVPHYAMEDIDIDGMTIPKNSSIIISLLSVHFDPSVWKDPEEFYPGRFLNKDGQFFKPEGFVPFSLGPRICLGKQLADTELFLFFVSILQRFHLAPENESDYLDTEGIHTGVTNQPKPFKVRFIQK